jgi:hypothetical protein
VLKAALTPGAELSKLTTIDASTEDLDPTQFCDRRRPPPAAAGAPPALSISASSMRSRRMKLRLGDARFCRRAIRDRGVIVFHDRVLVDHGIQRFLSESSGCRAYPLAHDLFVVEINVPSLLDDPRVRAQVPSKAWLVVDRLRVVPLVLRFAPIVRALRQRFASRP